MIDGLPTQTHVEELSRKHQPNRYCVADAGGARAGVHP
jgi:hypothetical protein